MERQPHLVNPWGLRGDRNEQQAVDYFQLQAGVAGLEAGDRVGYRGCWWRGGLEATNSRQGLGHAFSAGLKTDRHATGGP